MSKNEPESGSTSGEPQQRPGGNHGQLTVRQNQFCLEYVKDLNATQAAVRAGYSAKTAAQAAARLLKLVKIQEALAGFQRDLAASLMISPRRVLAEYARIAFSNMADYVDIDNSGAPHIDLSHLTRDQAAALSETTVESYMEGSGDNAQMVKRVRIKFHSKTQALEALSRNLGLFAEDNSQGVKSLVEIMAIVMGEKHDAK
jgi:phage terminase small subunit